MNSNQQHIRRSVALALGAVGVLAQAQTSEPPAVEAASLQSVQVTAQKRLQSTQDVPLSMAVVSGEELRDKGITSVRDLSNAAPGLQITDYGSPVITVVTLRGVQQFDFSDHQESPVAVFLDGSYVPYLSAVGMSIFDLARVEVLRGPQGTLFGRNATGGVLQLITAKPTERFGGYADLKLGNLGTRRAEAALSGHVGGGWLGRASLLKEQHDGYFKNTLGGEKGDADNQSWRLQLQREIGQGGRLNLMARGSQDKISTFPSQASATYPDPNTGLYVRGNGAAFGAYCNSFFGVSPQGANPVNCFAPDQASSNRYSITHDSIGSFKRRYHGFSATVDLPLTEVLTLTSITSYGKLRKAYNDEDADGTSQPLLSTSQGVRARDFAQELRVDGSTGRLTWVAGVYYLDIDGTYSNSIPAFGINPIYGLHTRSAALFGQGEYKLAKEWTLVSGLRWSDDRKTFNADNGPIGADPTLPLDSARHKNNWDGKLQLNWTPERNLLVYGGVSRGTKAGGYNQPIFLSPGELPFDDEVLTAYEIGFKRTFWDNKARFNVSAYHYAYADAQVFSQSGLAVRTFNRNAKVNGVDADLQLRIAPGTDLQLAASLLKSRIDAIAFAHAPFVPGAYPTVVASQEMPNAPKQAYSIGLRKQWTTGVGVWTAQGDARWVGARKLNLINHPATRDPSYALWNTSVAYAPPGGGWELGVYVKNLTKEGYRVASTPFVADSGSVIDIYNEPRTFGATLRVSF